MSDEYDFGIAYSKKDARIKVMMNEFRGTWYIHIREWMLDGDTGKLYPSTKGYAILAEEVDSIIELLEKASKIAGNPYRKIDQLSFDFGTKE